jgi:putative transposase
MPRTRRHIHAGTVYHVHNRGNERARIFTNDNDYRGYLGLMEEAAVRVPMRVVGFTLMPNHVHLLLWPEDDGAVSAYMKWLTGTHALQHRFRSVSVGTGHVYQGRFKCHAVQTEGYYYTCLNYIEGNAPRAGLVTRPEYWPWSSLFERIHGGNILSDGPLSLPENWVDIVNAGPGAKELQELRACARASRPYGTHEWVEQAVARHHLLPQPLPRGRPRRK